MYLFFVDEPSNFKQNRATHDLRQQIRYAQASTKQEISNGGVLMRTTIRTAFLTLLALGLLVGTGLAQATEPSGSAGNMNAQTASTSDSQQALTDPGQIYNDKTPASWMGKSVTFKNVSVQDT